MPDGEELVPWGEPLPLTQQQRLTQQFYDWEKRGRGWQLWDYPVELEPPFRPFLVHFAGSGPIFDDAHKPTFLSALIERVRRYWGGPASVIASPTDLLDQNLMEEAEPVVLSDKSNLVELAVALPPRQPVGKETTEQFLLGLSCASRPTSFEIIGLPESIVLQLTCREPDEGQVRQQIQAYFPEAVVHEEAGFLDRCWDNTGLKETVIVDFGLSREFMLPLKTFKGFEVDPLIGITGALADLQEGELGLLQVLFQATRHAWSENIIRAVTDWEGRSFFADAPEMVSLAKQKVSRPLYSVVVRVAGQSSTSGRAWQIAKALGGSLAQFSNPFSNELIPLDNEDYSQKDQEEDVLYRESHRSGIILNTDELASLVHLPSPSVRSEKLKREEKRTKAAPTLALGHKLLLGENTHGGKKEFVTLGPEQRIRHTYLIGASGTGKSTLLLNLIIQDIKNGEGIAVLDPHGDLIDQILGFIPEERFADVVLLDPADEEYPVGFNILSAHSELEKNLLASDLVGVFRRLSTSWGDQMTSVLGNAILAFLESQRGGTLADLRRFLVEAAYRRDFLETVADPEVVYYWQKEFPLLSGRPQAPLLTRLDTFLRPKLIRYIVSQKENRLDFQTIMNNRKIFLAKLAQGAIGEENAYLLGTLLVSKLHQIAISRQQIRESERQNFYLYIDEFHNFITPSMAAILSGARKYHLGLILAHQELRQIWNKEMDIASAVISNPYTRICFRLGDFDAQKLKDGFSFFEAKDLQNLGTGEAIARLERAEYDFNLKALPLPGVDIGLASQRRERLVALSREKYARRRVEIEAELARGRPVASPPTPVREVRPRKETKEPAIPVDIPPRDRKVREQPRFIPQEPAPLGRGGQHHKYLQQLVKRLADDRGYRTTIEKLILGGVGSVDVSLEKGGRKIACEISVTSGAEQELGNVQKCLAAGYDQVILLSSERKALSKIREFVAARIDEETLRKVLFLPSEEFVDYLDQVEAGAASKEQTVRGYKVKVGYRPVGEKEKQTRRKAVYQVFRQALNRLKGSD